MKKVPILVVNCIIFLLIQTPSWAAGECLSGNCYDTHSSAKWSSGNTYTGSYHNGRRSGQGVFTWARGDKYIGEYKEGKMHGIGTYLFANGSKYEGEYINNVRNGYGIFTWPNGARYEGEYKNGKKNGNGKFIFPGGMVLNGIWNHDSFADSLLTGQQQTEQYSLTINPLPTTAKIKLLEYNTPYQAGIKLPVGRYKIEISNQYYAPKIEFVDIRDRDLIVPITLKLASTTEPKKNIGTQKLKQEKQATNIDTLMNASTQTIADQQEQEKSNQQRIDNALQENESAQKISMIEQLHQEVSMLKESFEPVTTDIKNIPDASSNYERIALVIGNSRYPSLGTLKNPENDAKDIATELRGLDFAVMMQLNADQKTMASAISEFGKRIKNGGLGLFYYAGHALQMDNINYLIPIQAQIKQAPDIPQKAINLNSLLAKMAAAKNGKNIIILDACRNNPLPKANNQQASNGLARTEAPAGTLIAYATGPGSVAIDGKGRNGIYTKYLLNNINTPNIPIETVFKRVLQSVTAETNRKQIPWMSSALEIDFYFVNNQLARTR